MSFSFTLAARAWWFCRCCWPRPGPRPRASASVIQFTGIVASGDSLLGVPGAYGVRAQGRPRHDHQHLRLLLNGRAGRRQHRDSLAGLPPTRPSIFPPTTSAEASR
ncbi:MAG: hypothetical protein WKG07_32975 [Hymenobacter sp.]